VVRVQGLVAPDFWVPASRKTDLLLACSRQWLRIGERVLFITEEPVTIWQHRLKLWAGAWTNLQGAFGLGADPAMLRKLAREGEATVVVVDALRNLLHLIDEKDNSEIARVVNPWVVDARVAEKTLVLAHHQRKGGGEHGEGIAGGHALMGAFDIPIEVLWDPSKGTNRRLVRSYPRLIEAKEGLYEKVGDGEFVYVGDPAAVALSEVTDKARSLLTEDWQSTDEIRDGMDEPQPSKEQVRVALTDLAKRKLALRDPSVDSGPAVVRPTTGRGLHLVPVKLAPLAVSSVPTNRSIRWNSTLIRMCIGGRTTADIPLARNAPLRCIKNCGQPARVGGACRTNQFRLRLDFQCRASEPFCAPLLGQPR